MYVFKAAKQLTIIGFLFFAFACGSLTSSSSSTSLDTTSQPVVAVSGFQYSAQNALNSCSATRDMLIYRPAADGDYPVLIYLAGTGAEYDGYYADRFLRAAAQRGFIAASVDYRNSESAAAGCTALAAKAKCIFDNGRATSAVSSLCDLRDGDVRADCRLGLVTTGHGQGGAVAMLANDWNSDHVRATWAQGTPLRIHDVRSARGSRQYNWEPCLQDVERGGSRMLPNERLFLTAGESDAYGRNADMFTGVFELEAGESVADHLLWMIGGPRHDDPTGQTGSSSLGEYSIVLDHEVGDGIADHCLWQTHRNSTYDFKDRECYNEDPTGPAGAGWEEAWFAEGNPLSLGTRLDWLKARTGNPFAAAGFERLIDAPAGGRIDVLHNDSWTLPLDKIVFDSPKIKKGTWAKPYWWESNARCRSFAADSNKSCAADYSNLDCWVDEADGRMHVGCTEGYHCWDVGFRPDPSLCHGGFDIKVMNADKTGQACLTCEPEVREALGLPDKNIGQPAWHNASGGRFLVVQVQNGDTDEPGGPWDGNGFGWCKEPCFTAHPGGGVNSNLWLLELNPGGESIKKATPITNYETQPRPEFGSPDFGVLHPHFSKDGTRLLWAQMWRGSRPAQPHGATGYWTINWADFDVTTHTQALAPEVIRSADPGDTSVTPCEPVRDENYAVDTDVCDIIEPGSYVGAWFETHGFVGDSNERVIVSGNLPNKIGWSSQVYIYDLVDESLQLLSNGARDYHEMAKLSPDGKTILYLTSKDSAGSEWWIMNADTTGKRVVSSFTDPESLMYDPEVPSALALDVDWLSDQSGLVGYQQVAAGKRQGSIVRIDFVGPTN